MSLGASNGKNGAAHRQLTDDLFTVETAVSPSAPKPSSPSPRLQNELTAGCPHFGSGDDAAIRYLFASPDGTCYRAQPPEVIALSHQQAFCLGAQHSECPVFKQAAAGPLPAAIQAEPVKGRGIRPWVWAVLGLIVVITAVWLLFGRAPGTAVLATPFPIAAVGLAPTQTPTAAPSPLPTSTATAVPLASPTAVPPSATPLPPTATPLPSATPKPTLPATFTPAPPASATVPPTAVPQISVIVPNLNVRQGPDTEYPIIGTVGEGAQYNVVGQSYNGGWWQICCVAGQPGWVFGESVTITGDTANVPVVSAAPPQPEN